MKRPRAGGGDAKMWRERAIRIDLQGRKGKNDLFNCRMGQPFNGGHEKSHVARHPIDIRITRHDQQHGRGPRSGTGHGKSLRGLCQPGNPTRRDRHAASRDGGLEQGLQGKRSRDGHRTTECSTVEDQSLNLSNYRTRRIAFGNRDTDHTAPASFHNVAADNPISRPVRTLDQDIGLKE